jgi:hypothetical protein
MESASSSAKFVELIAPRTEAISDCLMEWKGRKAKRILVPLHWIPPIWFDGPAAVAPCYF